MGQLEAAMKPTDTVFLSETEIVIYFTTWKKKSEFKSACGKWFNVWFDNEKWNLSSFSSCECFFFC